MGIDPVWVESLATAGGLILVPGIVLLIRREVRWSRTERDLAVIKDDISKMVDLHKEGREEAKVEIDKVISSEQHVHNELFAQMRIDRETTDKRLRFIEEYWMKKGQGGS